MKTTAVALAAMEVFRDKMGKGSSDIAFSNVLALLTIGQHAEIPVAHVEKALGLSQAATSRNLTRLGPGRPGEPGMHLVEQYEDPYDRRNKIAKLTPEGREILRALDVRLARLLKVATND